MNNQASYRNTRVENREEVFGDNVDILFSVVGGSKPPILPLREERQTDGVELVYNAKGTGHSAVCKEKKRREEMLLEKLDRLEQKLARKPSYKRTKKRQKALKMVRELKAQLENSASGISYKRYLDELKQMRKTLKAEKSVDDASEVSQTSASTANIESKVMKALQTLLDDPELDLDHGSDSASDVHTADGSRTAASDSSIALPTDSANETTVNETAVDKDATVSDENVYQNEELNGKDGTPNATLSSRNDHIERKKVSTPSKSQGVRFKDVKPSVDDHLEKARALLNHAKIVQKSFSNESNQSINDDSMDEQPSNDESETKPKQSPQTDSIRQVYSHDGKVVGDQGRYHLFVSHACSWSHRCLVVRALKRLQDIVSVSYVQCKWDPQPIWDDHTVKNTEKDSSFWVISNENPDFDPVLNSFQRLYMANQEADSVRVPILWDKKEDKVISTESAQIMKILNFEFNQWSRRPKLNLFPAGFKQENENINRWLHEQLYLGIYRSGLATTQAQYDQAIQSVTKALDEANNIVKKRGFLAGHKLTESDVRLFVVLLRFDEVYRVLFKANTRIVANMPGLMEFMRDIYQVKGLKEICNLDCIKKEFYGAKGGTFIIPKGGTFMKALSNDSTI